MTSDDSYAQHMGVAIASVLANRPREGKTIFHILDGGISEENKVKIKSLAREGAEIIFVSLNQDLFRGFPEMRHLKKSAYYRLFAPYIINASKLLYLDCDLIACADLQSLYDINLQDKTIGAVRDVSEEYVRRYFFRPISRYFNTGVMLIDSERWRSEKIWEKSLTFLGDSASDKKIKYADQDILNHLLEHDWEEVEWKYNFQLDRFQKIPLETDYAILHFVGSLKPWHYMYDNPFGQYYKKYLLKGPWKNDHFNDKKIWSPAIRFMRRLVHHIRLILQKFLPQSLVSELKKIKLSLNNRRDSR